MKRNIPKHIAIVVDGNRRWAIKNGLSVGEGHSIATNKTIEKLIFTAMEHGVSYLTFWAFSTENWKRGKGFTSMLFGILEDKMNQGVEKYNQAGIKLKIIGDLSKIPERLAKRLLQWQKESAKNSKITVVIALNYGGRDEIVRAVNKILDEKLKARNKALANITEQEFEKYLDTKGVPDPDLIVRTGGSQRMSGFLPWQSVYSEYYFSDVLFPDFGKKEFEKALTEYSKRQRRFGK